MEGGAGAMLFGVVFYKLEVRWSRFTDVLRDVNKYGGSLDVLYGEHVRLK